MDRLLTRQLKRTVGDGPWPPAWDAFIRLVEQTYREHDADRRFSEHALETVSAEVTQMNEQLRLKVRALEQLEVEMRQSQKLEAVGQLASGIAHEINTPIQFVGDSISFVQNSLVQMGTLQRHYAALTTAVEHNGSEPMLAQMAATIRRAEEEADLEYIIENVPQAIVRSQDGLQRVATIVRAMKGFAHADTTDKVLADVNKGLSDTLIVADNSIKYIADVETVFGDLPHVRCFAGDLNQVFLNLLINAAHAIEDVVGTTGDRGRITITTAVDGPWAVIRIADTGAGIPESIRERIFDLFFTTKDVGRGTGQGLAIVRSIIVDQHGGTISFDSVPGRGTTFELRIPIDGGMNDQ